MAPARIPAALAVAAAALLAACSGSATTSPTTATTVPVGTISPVTAAPTTTTTTTAVVTPPAPQPTPSSAADALIRGWESGNRAYAASVATAPAVATLFAHPYQGQTAISRGCTTAFPPVVCSYGPNGGGSGSLYQVTLTQTGKGWYVSSVIIEG